MADTLYADISEWQVGVNDTYPYPVLCIRSNDGTYRDRRWVNNYGWCLSNVDSGRLTFSSSISCGGLIGARPSRRSNPKCERPIRRWR